jgi:hypothetical protein
VPWISRKNRNAKGTLFKQYHLIRAKNATSAFKKAERILQVSEHLEGGSLNGRKVTVEKVGILDLEPLYECIQSGVELFDESEVGVCRARARKLAMSNSQKRQLIAYERRNGKPQLLGFFGVMISTNSSAERNA